MAAAIAIDTAPKRARLTPRRNPYWQGVSGGRGGVSLGYRKSTHGTGSWVAKIVVGGRRIEERIGDADDDGAPAGALPYRSAVAAALEWGQRQHAGLERSSQRGAARAPLTVRLAIVQYMDAKPKSLAAEITRGRLSRYVLADEEFAATPLSKLTAAMIEAWRSRIPARRLASSKSGLPELAPSTLNRLLNDVRAALNAAAERRRRELPGHLPMEIKVGTRAIPHDTVARKQLLTDEEVRRLIAAAFAIDVSGDFGRLVLVAAATGARFSQLVKLKVADVQPDRGRILVPGSRKGRARSARAPVAVPVSAEVLTRLAPALTGRTPAEPLLQRWAYRRGGGLKWTRHARRSWAVADEIAKPWAAAVAAADLPKGSVMYALRHSSIVRGLTAGLPVRLVAALHDTSSEMIELHYSAFIVDATEELARRVALVA